jgi:hypothetical protein
MYDHFYNYLPQFFANSLKGVAIIFEMDQMQIQHAFEVGLEMGYFYQFSIFAYILTAIINQSEKQAIKEHLKTISNILQYLSFETIEKMLYQMKTLNMKKLQTEFLTLTDFHYKRVSESLEIMDIDDEVKQQMMQSLSGFRTNLFEMANFQGEEVDVSNIKEKY